MEVIPAVPFEEDLYLIFDTEVFTWAGLPTISSLKNDSKNTMLVDFVRSYKITNNTLDTGSIKNGSFEMNGAENWLWKGNVSLNTLTTNLNDGVFNVNLKNGGSIMQKISVTKNQDYELSLSSKINSGSLNVELVDIADKIVTVSNWDEQVLNFNSGDQTEVYVKISASSSGDSYINAIIIK